MPNGGICPLRLRTIPYPQTFLRQLPKCWWAEVSDSADKLRIFLDPPQRLPYDPLRLAGMEPALRRIYQAINHQEMVGVFGDFDVDGVTGTAIVAEGLEAFGLRVLPYLPHRTEEGHGLSTAAIQHLIDQGVTLIVTVDCGVTSLEEVVYARRVGADIIITDHHLPHSDLPDAAAIINPQLPGGSYPFLNLCGAGLAFKLAQGLYQFHGQPWDRSLLELAALGTIADLVPLLDENRYLVQEGLAALAQTQRPGLQALYRLAAIQPGPLDHRDRFVPDNTPSQLAGPAGAFHGQFPLAYHRLFL